ncbi:PASTA domain-containing protein [Pleionea sediminis]|uniref:PASTA domain-containing protein n=1 Tax=Pleionea sediminis TaxID=2569479 RepID=UPI0011847F97|nr:PASTA domain-containing protein [Pleionea sediminis]
MAVTNQYALQKQALNEVINVLQMLRIGPTPTGGGGSGGSGGSGGGGGGPTPIEDIKKAELEIADESRPSTELLSRESLTNTSARYSTSSDAITIIREQATKLINIRNALDGVMLDKNSEISSLNNDISSLSRTVQQKQSVVDSLNSQKLALESSNNQKQSTITQLTSARNTAETQRDQAISERDIAISEKNALSNKVVTLESEVSGLETKNSELEAELLTSDSKLLEANEAIETLNSELENINEVHASNIETLKESLQKDYQEAQEDLIKEMEVIKRDAGAESSLQSFIETTNSNLAAVQEKLKAGGGAYSLGPIKMSLKVLPGAKGDSVSLPKLTDLKEVSNDHLSTIDVTFMPNQKSIGSGQTDDSAPSPKMIDLSNMTATHAKRKLTALGLQVQQVNQMVKDKTKDGRILKQIPTHLEDYPQNGTVTVWVGKLPLDAKSTEIESGK